MTKDTAKHLAVIVAGGIGVALLLRHSKSADVSQADSVVMPDTYPSVMQVVPAADKPVASGGRNINIAYNFPSNRSLVNNGKGCCECDGKGSAEKKPTAVKDVPNIHSDGTASIDNLAEATANTLLAAADLGITDTATLEALARQEIFNHFGF
jgi:hypothetical protein